MLQKTQPGERSWWESNCGRSMGLVFVVNEFMLYPEGPLSRHAGTLRISMLSPVFLKKSSSICHPILVARGTASFCLWDGEAFVLFIYIYFLTQGVTHPLGLEIAGQ